YPASDTGIRSTSWSKRWNQARLVGARIRTGDRRTRNRRVFVSRPKARGYSRHGASMTCLSTVAAVYSFRLRAIALALRGPPAMSQVVGLSAVIDRRLKFIGLLIGMLLII